MTFMRFAVSYEVGSDLLYLAGNVGCCLLGILVGQCDGIMSHIVSVVPFQTSLVDLVVNLLSKRRRSGCASIFVQASAEMFLGICFGQAPVGLKRACP